MARSEEALRRRAEKRGRTVSEQRAADALEEQKQQAAQQQAQAAPTVTSPPTAAPKDARLQEVGAWMCPQCGNHNFASRYSCHSVTCRQKRPTNRPQKQNNKRDRTTNDAAPWNIPVADDTTLAANRRLRERFIETAGKGMTVEEQERAKILIARDERKRQKKKHQDPKALPEASSTSSPTKQPSPPKQSAPKKNPTPPNLEKKALLQRYLDTAGKGMTTEEQERAQILVARQERRAKRRHTEQVKSTSTTPTKNQQQPPPDDGKQTGENSQPTTTTNDQERAQILLARKERRAKRRKVEAEANRITEQ